jgi:hypothetical protein
VQLGFFSVIFAVFSLMGQYEEFNDKGLLHGYSYLTWAIIITLACGGLLVALVIQYCDSIIKGFATATGIILTSVLSYVFLHGEIGIPFICGSANVISSIFIFNGGENNESEESPENSDQIVKEENEDEDEDIALVKLLAKHAEEGTEDEDTALVLAEETISSIELESA